MRDFWRQLQEADEFVAPVRQKAKQEVVTHPRPEGGGIRLDI